VYTADTYSQNPSRRGLLLPEFPTLEDEFNRAITRYMRAKAKTLEAVFAEVPHHRIFEGREIRITRTDGTEETSPFVEASSELTISFDELETLDLPSLLKKLEANVEKVVEQKTKHFFQTISEAVERVGNTIDGKGQGLSAELYLQVVDKIWIEFDADGRPKLPTLVVHPDQRDAAARMHEELVSNPVLRRRFQEILERKREIWRARETDRELVG